MGAYGHEPPENSQFLVASVNTKKNIRQVRNPINLVYNAWANFNDWIALT